jgi:hypothetical protein
LAKVFIHLVTLAANDAIAPLRYARLEAAVRPDIFSRLSILCFFLLVVANLFSALVQRGLPHFFGGTIYLWLKGVRAHLVSI